MLSKYRLRGLLKKLIIILCRGFTFMICISPVSSAQTSECIDTFQTFAYQIPKPFAPPDKRINPLDPWHSISTIPPHHISGYSSEIHQLDVVAVRQIGQATEIWLRGVIYSDENQLPRLVVLLRYNEANASWEYVSSALGIPNLYVWNIFVVSDGTVWGNVEWNYYFTGGTIPTNDLPILSRFNEDIGHFEIPDGVIYTPPPVDNYDFNMTYIAMVESRVFWIFNVNDFIYRYDALQGRYERYEVNLNASVRDVAFAPNGEMYLVTGTSGAGELTLKEFSPDSRRLVSVFLPNSDWETYNGILVDRSERLWVGANGYRDINQNWQLLQPSPKEDGYELLWAPATPVLASSDGRLWYNRFLDTSGWAEGTAWYDPVTNQGCWFTHFPANIVEDNHHRLWLAANDVLYSLNLRS